MSKKLLGLFILASLMAFVAISVMADDGKVPPERQCTLKHDDPNTVNWNIDDQESDWSDSPFLPTASHLYQHYEWLGATVDQEAGVNVTDDGPDDDGLISAVIDPTNGAVQIRFGITTSYSAHPGAFPLGTREFVEAWVDWNNNLTFEPSERVGLGWNGSPKTWGGTDTHDDAVLGAAGGAPGTYNVRIRLYWSHAPRPAAPGGAYDWGEVEDYEGVEFVAGELPAPEYGQVAVPSMSTWALITLVLLLLGAAVWVVRRNRAGGIA
ncbi:MAG TPA: IPTL-CTERM sorting domain-containing protein [candidate division Zixibacteria bacterium]|nr:IPTL-CTERM sorting domain-containing protein [candidate division Zixibacteria bacterium]